MTAAFTGFPPQGLQFLVDLGQHNERPWFQARKGEYERLLKGPLEALCGALGAEFAARDLPLSSDAARSPFRIYRDVRFSRDKTPYKTYVSASFPWSGDGGGVGGYFHLQPGHIYVGGGMWHPSPARLAAWRAAIVADRAGIHDVVDEPAFVDRFGPLDGDRLQRAPSGYRTDDPDLDLLRLKDVTFGRLLADAEAGDAALPATIAETLAAAVPLLRLLAGLPGLDAPAGWLRG